MHSNHVISIVGVSRGVSLSGGGRHFIKGDSRPPLIKPMQSSTAYIIRGPVG